MENDEKKQISYGKLMLKSDFEKNTFIPNNVREKLKTAPYYLFIFIPADDIVKLSIFPCQNNDIKKILIRLKEFSPDLVKGISDVLKKFNLDVGTIHTTGLCFEAINCFYETYVDATTLREKNILIENVKKEFLNVQRVKEVKIIDIQPESD
ncbi:MAG: hypothetical protein ACTSWX_05255 [Promethearchaeota archaeon]